VHVQLFYFDGCPSWQKALENLRVALEQEGISSEVELVRVESAEDAIEKRFLGSPTIRIEGEDLEGPEAEAKGYQYGCRVYFDQGRPLGWPSVELIRSAIQRARKRSDQS